MPSGSTHDRITLWGLPWVAGITFAITRDSKITLITSSAFLFSGLMFGPDLDIYSRQFQRWGKLRWIWLPYQKKLRHRSYLSHGAIVGTTIRLLYLGCILVLFSTVTVAIAQSIVGFAWNWQNFAKQIFQSIYYNYQEEAIALFVGLEVGAMSHSFSDLLYSAYKRRKAEGRSKGVRVQGKQGKQGSRGAGETRRRGDKETGRQGDGETRRRGDKEQGRL
jgi:uncharacterized metal-binding protein